jgi:hypothetical protein
MANIRHVNANEGYSDSEFGSDKDIGDPGYSETDFKLPPIKK